MVRIINGRFHQGQICSQAAGYQCTAIALAVILFTVGNHVPSLRNWSTNVVDEVMMRGHNLYEQILTESGNPSPRYLGHWELPSALEIDSELVHLTYYNDIFYGLNLPYTNQNLDAEHHGHGYREDGSMSLYDGIEAGGRISDFMLVTVESSSFSILRCDGDWYLFDSHGRNENGISSNTGFASLLSFENLQELTAFINTNYCSGTYNLTPVFIERPICEEQENDSTYVMNEQQDDLNIVEMETQQESKLSVSLNGNHLAKGTCSENSKCKDGKSSRCCGKKDDLLQIKRYEEHIQQKIEAYCMCCEKILFPEQIRRCNFCNFSNPFDENIPLRFEPNSIFCSLCASSLNKNKIPSTCKYNNVFSGNIPPCIKKLGIAEKRMIAQLQSYMTILMLPGGQFAEKGLAIHFPMDMNEYCDQLKNMVEEHFIILDSGNEKPQTQMLSFRKVANFQHVKDALQWLKIHNHLYDKVPNLVSCNIEFPLEPQLINRNVTSCRNEYIRKQLNTVPQCTVIPNDFVQQEYDIETLIRSGKKISLPTQFQQPVWLSDIPHGEELAYPSLFPLGVGGLNERRIIPLTLMKYFQMRLYNKDNRWRQDIPYLMFSVNHMEQQKLGNEIEIQMRVNKVHSVTAGSLNNNPEIFENSYMFMKNIRGTVAYWTNVLYDLLAMVKCLGPPTIFMTLSADDCHWTELDMLLTGRTYEECLSCPSSSSNMLKDPLLTSVHFERRWKYLLRDIVKGKLQPFGKIVDHFARIEYQNRGSPHLHIFFWVYNAPNLHTSSSNEIISFIDSIMRSTKPTKEDDEELHNLVCRLQVHHHTSSCQRRNLCRFGFPRPAAERTHLLQNVDVTNPRNRGRFYETARTIDDQYVNAYNDVILRRWRANMDIQMVSGSHGLAYYVCSYIAKAEPDDLKQALGKVIQDVSSQPQAYSLKRKLYTIGNTVLKSRRLSAQEAAARIGHLQFIWKSREVVFLNTRPIDQRFRLLKPKNIRDKLPNNSTEIFCTNILDYYADRPIEMEKISLFKFASNYKISQSQNVDVTMRSLPRFKLQTLGKIMQQRRNTAVIRTPGFRANSDEYFFSLLMLHLPYRKETEIIGSHSTAKAAFINKNHLFDIDNVQYSSYLHDIERVVRLIRATNEDLGALIAPNTDEGFEMSEENVAEEFTLMSCNVLPQNCDNSTEFSNNFTSDINVHNLQVNLLSEDEISDQIERLNTDQQKVFNIIQGHFNSHCRHPLHMFISGEGGTGKSFLIKTLVEWIRCYTASFPGGNPVLVCGPTGMSAKNIQGKTIHSVLKLPIQHGKEPEYKELSNRVLQQLRCQVRNVHTLVIDEISMVSNSMLIYIHRRLCAIKQNNEYFGGMNIILIGDFFQLKPIRGQFAFTNTLLWSLFDNFILNTNVRQATDVSYSLLLSRIRQGRILRSEIDVLLTRMIADDDERFIGALRVFPTVREVTEYNKMKQEHLNKHCIQHVAIHEFHSTDTGVNDCIDNFIPNDDRDAGGLPRVLSLSPGTRVMLIRNIATDQGLVNGALGFVKTCYFENGQLLSIYVQFDDETIGSAFYNSEHNAIGIEQISQEFYFEGRSISRTQFPLLPAWACTIHKVQGISTDKIVVSLGKTVFAEGQFYVALSRVRTLNGLGILSLDPSRVKADKKVITFYENLSLDCKHIHN